MTTNTDLRIPEIAHLQDVAARLARAALVAGDRRNLNALNKAAYHLDRGIEIRIIAGDVLIPSATSVGTVYRVSGAGCSCEAGQHGHACWHSSVAEILLVAWDELGGQDDGDAGNEGGEETQPPTSSPVETFERRLHETAAILDLMRAEQKQSRVETEVARPMGVRLAQARAIIADLYEWVD